jgi:hypothetical protein
MNHYFDDIFTRHVSASKSNNKSRSPHKHMRRSSTSRSIGGRSDFDPSVNGDTHDDARSIGNSVATETEERERERREADEHTAHYVSEQLERVRSHQSADFETGDEFEAQLDGQ